MPKTLLLADDSVTIQKVVGITFANEDVELVTVDNGDDALPRARQVKPDLILADIGMPGLNGYELCAAIRRDPNLSHIPVLLLTGTFETYDEQKAREVGASGHIAKPFEAQALVDRVFQLLSQATPAPAPPKPAEVTAPPQAPVARPAAAPPAPVRPPAPATMRPPAPAPTSPRPAPQAAPPSAPAPRARPELPPVPHAPAPAAQPRPAPVPAAAPAPAPRTVVPAPKRETTPFEFELPDVPAAPASVPSSGPALADQEPVWEAEPEAEVLADESAFGTAGADLHTDVSEEPPTSDSTRLFAPDLLGRAAQLPEVPEPPRAPAVRKGDFSFGDLDFEEPTNPASNQSGIFGESSEPNAEFEPEFVQSLPADAPLEVEALADPLYSQTTFLEPAGADGGAPRFAGPSPAAPPLPDLLDPTPPPYAGDDAEEELELAEADTALDDQASEATDPLAKPFSPDTAAALAAPRFERPPAPTGTPDSATRLMWEDEPKSPPVRPTPPPRSTAPARVPAAEADTLPPRVQRESVPAPVSASRASAIVDSTLLAQSVEKVAWEAFGSLSEQVVGEVLKRVEAVVWEVVPALCERLIREEIARLKAEMSD